MQTISKMKKIILSALLLALTIVLSRFLSFNTSLLSIGFSFVPMILAAIWLGPKYAAIICGLADLIGALLFPFGTYFIGFTPDVVTGVWVGNDDNSRMGELTGGTVPARIWKDVMQVATEPYGNSDFEYPEIILNPFKAPGVSIIPQSEARKELEEAEKKARELEEQQKNNTPPEPPIVKPDSIKPTDMLQIPNIIKKKETPTIEVKQERLGGEEESIQYAPIPVTTAPIGQ